MSKEAIEKCHKLVQLPGDYCMNVALAGSIMMYDRHSNK
jgi:tRNA C32,U32 (ribose-2'-O)-methylase TrmJ